MALRVETAGQAHMNGLAIKEGSLFPQDFTPLRNFYGQHLISAAQFDRKSLEIFCDEASRMEQRRKMDKWRLSEELRGHNLANLFYQDSTRSRLTLESAMDYLGGRVITETQSTTAQKKGEPIEHTVRVISGLVDVIGLRHPESGIVFNLANYSKVPIINAGDGNREHVLQGLKDYYHIQKLRGGVDKIDGLELTFYGDLMFSRVFHSTARMLGLHGVKWNLWSPVKEFGAPGELVDIMMSSDGSEVNEYFGSEGLERLEKDGGPGDITYVNRKQKNLWPQHLLDDPAYSYAFPQSWLDRYPGMVVMHAMPVDGEEREIPREMDFNRQLRMFEQSDDGLPVGLAALKLVTKGNTSPIAT